MVTNSARHANGLPPSSRQPGRHVWHKPCVPGSEGPGNRLRLATEQAKLGTACSDGTLSQNAMQLPLWSAMVTTPPFWRAAAGRAHCLHEEAKHCHEKATAGAV